VIAPINLPPAGRPGMHGQNHANLVPARSSTVAGLQSREYVHATSAGLRWLLPMPQHWARSRNRHTQPRTKKREKSCLYFGCDFSGWYTFGKIATIIAARRHILKLKCTKFDFGWRSTPDPAVRAYSALSDPLAGFKGAYV